MHQTLSQSLQKDEKRKKKKKKTKIYITYVHNVR